MRRKLSVCLNFLELNPRSLIQLVCLRNIFIIYAILRCVCELWLKLLNLLYLLKLLQDYKKPVHNQLSNYYQLLHVLHVELLQRFYLCTLPVVLRVA